VWVEKGASLVLSLARPRSRSPKQIERRTDDEHVPAGKAILPQIAGDAHASQLFRAKLDQRTAELVSALLHDLSDAAIRKSGVVRTTTWLLRLGQGERARETFLSARGRLVRKRARQIKFEGDISMYISELAMVCFTLIKNTCEWYMAAFKDNRMASGASPSSPFIEPALFLSSLADSDFSSRRLCPVGERAGRDLRRDVPAAGVRRRPGRARHRRVARGHQGARGYGASTLLPLSVPLPLPPRLVLTSAPHTAARRRPRLHLPPRRPPPPAQADPAAARLVLAPARRRPHGLAPAPGQGEPRARRRGGRRRRAQRRAAVGRRTRAPEHLPEPEPGPGRGRGAAGPDGGAERARGARERRGRTRGGRRRCGSWSWSRAGRGRCGAVARAGLVQCDGSLSLSLSVPRVQLAEREAQVRNEVVQQLFALENGSGLLLLAAALCLLRRRALRPSRR